MAFIQLSQTKFNFLSYPECLSLAEIADVTGIPHVDPYDTPQPLCCLSHDVIGNRGFCTAAPTIWNSLPANVRSCAALSTFHRHLKSHFSSPASPLPSDPSQRLWFFTTMVLYKYTYLLTYFSDGRTHRT